MEKISNFKYILLITLILFVYSWVFFRYEFLSIQITDNNQLIERCNRITGNCEASTPLTKEGLNSLLGIK